MNKPYALAMWDFSWAERRWPGAGYEDWNQALSELKERGYDAVRIEAYPHMVGPNPEASYHLLPCWTQMSWGAQSPIDLTPGPLLRDFLKCAREHGIKVALSSWYRQDSLEMRLRIRTPEDQANIWIGTLDYLNQFGLVDDLLFVDLCNEFPAKDWALYLYQGEGFQKDRTNPTTIDWMRRSIELVKARYPQLEYTWSFSSQLTNWREQDVSMLDLLETHIWMAPSDVSEFNDVVGYHFDRFKPDSFDNLAKNGRREYLSRQEYYDKCLFHRIDEMAEWSRTSGLPQVTSECWSIIDYKDWPGLEWDWVMDLNARAVEYACAKGRWTGISTSNFCGPQFVGMWRDIDWHRRLTDMIHATPIDEDLRK